MNLSLIAIGIISILGQVVLLRELNVAFYGVELIYLLALGIWLFWTATGALIGHRMTSPSQNHIAILFILFSICMPLDIIFIRSSRLVFGGIPGAYLNFFKQFAIAVISLFPAGLISGLLFQWTAKAYVADNKMLASAYAIESAGGLMGGLLSTLLIMWGTSNFSAALLCALIAAIIPLVLLTSSKIPVRYSTGFLLLGLFMILFWKASMLDQHMTSWNHPNLLESSDSPYGRVTVTKHYNQISIFENDTLAFETEGTDAESFCHLTALQHPHPQTVLILGGGFEGLMAEITKYHPRRIDYVELNSVMLSMVQRHLPADISISMHASNTQVILADPRQYLKNSGTYDLILVGMPEPASGQANRFYTREFFEQISGKLNPGGIVGLRIRTAENLWTAPLIRRNASIYNALQSVFSDVLFLPGTVNIVTASHTPLPHSPEIMSRRLQDMNIVTKLISPQYITYLFTNDRFMEIHDLLEKEKLPPNTDIRPVCYQYAFMIWMSKFFPRMVHVDISSIIDNIFFKPPTSLILWIGLPLLFLLSRLRPIIRRAMLVATAGFTGMVVETILILYYQVKHGVLYQDIGLLLMSFMAGLALGAIIIKHAMTRTIMNPTFSRWYGIGLLTGFCLLCAFTAMEMTQKASLGLIGISLLLASTGFLTAGVFAYASLHEIDDQKKVISPLYAADLIGGCIGSLLGSMILIPLVGLDVTVLTMLVFAALSIFLV